MDQKNILPRGIAKPIEQQPDGTWIVRHHFRWLVPMRMVRN